MSEKKQTWSVGSYIRRETWLKQRFGVETPEDEEHLRESVRAARRAVQQEMAERRKAGE